jgi:hypothetical protein
MHSESMDLPSQPDPTKPADCLTEAQRAFARIVGLALAEAWRREGSSGPASPPALPPKAARGRIRTD